MGDVWVMRGCIMIIIIIAVEAQSGRLLCGPQGHQGSALGGMTRV